MQRRIAIKSEGALDLSDYRWTKMLVRGQQRASEIAVAVARAGSSTVGYWRGVGFRCRANNRPHGEA